VLVGVIWAVGIAAFLFFTISASEDSGKVLSNNSLKIMTDWKFMAQHKTVTHCTMLIVVINHIHTRSQTQSESHSQSQLRVTVTKYQTTKKVNHSVNEVNHFAGTSVV